MLRTVELDNRQLKEIQLALYYRDHLQHGTEGHNAKLLLAQMADSLGFSELDGQLLWMHVPVYPSPSLPETAKISLKTFPISFDLKVMYGGERENPSL